MALHKKLSDSDKETFNLDISSLDWIEFFTQLVLGVRRYLHNEEMKTLSSARKKNQMLYAMNILIQVLVYVSLWYLTSVISSKSMSAVIWVVPLLYALSGTI